MSKFYLDLIDKERNIYELADLYPQNRKEVSAYIDILQDPKTGEGLKMDQNKLIGDRIYSIEDNVPNFTDNDINSSEWKKLNAQFLNYHKSLSVYTAVNSTPIINYLSLETEIGLLKDVKVLDIGGGTGHTHCSFFQFPETVEYYLLDPNLRLLHDQFLRFYPKLSFLKMGHILANAEFLPIKNNSFDVVLNLSAVDHFNDYKKFISETYRVLKPGGTFLISSHLDVPESKEDAVGIGSKLFSSSFWERVSRFLYYRKYEVNSDDHTLHLKDEKPIEQALLNAGFLITKQKVFKRHFYFVAKK
ncbi:MAG: class I SAM-dependent methyltransferase [Bacteroidota bacterium]